MRRAVTRIAGALVLILTFTGTVIAQSPTDTVFVTKTVTFDGFIRVWNEGHWKGVVHPSNPHHVLEVHPAWGFSAPGGSFDRKDLVTTITGYRGYGLAKYKKVLNEAGDWLKAYQDADHLYVQLQDASNFFQLPSR
jgi:hypothetical protein